MLPAVVRLLGRIWANLLSQLGTTTTAVVVFSFLLPMLGFMLALVPKIREAKRSGLTMAHVIKGSSFSWPTIVFVSLTVIAWLGLFGWISVKTVYQEHRTLVSDNVGLKQQIEILGHKNTDLEQKLAEKSIVPHVPTHKTTSLTQPNSSPLSSFTDGQRFILKKKLVAYKGHKILVILIGHEPQMNVAFEQIIDIFTDSGWAVQRSQSGQVGVVGMN